MRFAGVEFPQAIIDAQERGDLVIFAGAGVSRPEPSNLPLFPQLANELADGTAVLQEKEDIDRFLGRLPESLNIYERARLRLGALDSKPNSLHHSLLKVFLRPLSVRLVTTNFDDHFATAAQEEFSEDHPEMFFAPALPVGSDFQGIVHIHGSVRKNSRRMVLTDKDFGRAYLTEAWARRFVLDVFLRYTVLFIGYSHDDPVMHYLARGLPPDGSGRRRFALAPSGTESEASWENRGIQLLPYSNDDGHIQLRLACAKWAELVISTPLEMEARIKQIVSKPPQPEGEEIDLIKKAFSDAVLLRFFAASADSVEWLEWAAGRDGFKRLFKADTPSTDCDDVLAFWFAQKFSVAHSGLAIDMVRRNGSVLPPILWNRIVGQVWPGMKTGDSLSSLSKWVPLLIVNQPPHGGHLLEYILNECRLPEDSTPSVLLFSHLLRPVFQLTESLSKGATDTDFGPDVGADFRTRGGGAFLQMAWRKFQDSDFSRTVHQFVAIATAHLEEATLLFRAYGAEHEGWDPISIHLPRLERPNIVLSHDGLGVLVSVARESLKWIIQNEPERGPGLISDWSSAQSITLRRMAVYGVALTDQWTADAKLDWLLHGGYLYLPGFSGEVPQVLEAAFPNASIEQRESVAQCVIEGPTREMGRLQRDRNIYYLLSKLDGYLPGEPLVVAALADLREQYPEFRPVEETHRPEFGSFGQGYPPWKSLPFDTQSLVATTPDAALDAILNYEREHGADFDRDGVVSVLSQAANADAEWGFKFADSLQNRIGLENYLWRGVVSGWNNPQAGAGHWARVLSFMVDHAEIVSAAVGETVELLERGTSQETGGISDESLAPAIAVGRHAWAALLPTEWKREKAEEWLTVAINDPAGILMQFELKALVRTWKEAGGGSDGLLRDWQDHFAQVVTGKSWTAAMGRVLLASQVQVLFAIDPDWTTSQMPPVFDWDSDYLRAQQAWHGYMVWGQWSDDFLDRFQACYTATFPRLRLNSGEFRNQFCEHIAGIAVFSTKDPMANGWLAEFIRVVDEEDRVTWARSVGTMLKQVPVEKRQGVWDRWIKAYWNRRILGLPSLLSGGEAAAMIGWLIQLDSAFPEAVELFIGSPAPIFLHNYSTVYLYTELKDSGLDARFPNAVAKVLRRMLESESGFPYVDPIDELVRRLIPTDAERAVLLDICERLGALGYTGAAELKRLVQSPGQDQSS